MTRIQIPAAGLSGLDSSLSSSNAGGSLAVSSITMDPTNFQDMVHSMEAISVSTLHGMLGQVLEQTTALWKAQASTNRILDELRQSIPVPQENAEIHERLCRVESLVEMLTHSQRVLAQSSQAIGAGAFNPRSVPVSSFAPHPLPSQCRMMSTQETAPSSPAPHAGGEERSLPESLTRGGDEHKMPGTWAVPPSAHGDLLTADAVISPNQIRLSVPGHRSAPTSTISLVPPMQSGNHSAVTVQSPQDPLPESVLKPSLFPRSFEEAGVNSIQHVPSICVDKKVLMEQRLMRMASWPMGDQAAASKCEQSSRKIQDKHKIEKAVPDNIYRHDMEHEEFFRSLSDTWRADIRRLKEEIISAVRATASEQIPFNIHGYMDEFSRTLSTEVRVLLNEVGTLREERRRIQHDLGYLMMIQSTFRSGEFGADRLPDHPSLSSLTGRPSPTSIPSTKSPCVPRPAWRTLPSRGSRRSREAQVPPPPPVSVTRQHSWAAWQSSPALAPTPPSTEPTLLVPDRGSPGLFGPRSPRDSPPPVRATCQNSWVTWRPNPALTSSPPTEATQFVPRCGNPGLFGPRSPCNSPREFPQHPLPPVPGRRQSSRTTWQPSPAWISSPSTEATEFVPGHGSPGLFGPRSPHNFPRELPRKPANPESQGSCDSGWDAWGLPPLRRPISLFSSPVTLPVPGPTTPVLGRASSGLSVPRSPYDSLHERLASPESEDARDAGWDVPDAWQPSPLIAPTPPGDTPTIPVLERASPGLFGPRSPGRVPGALPSEGEEPVLSNTSPIVFRCGNDPSLFGPVYPTS